MGMRLLIAASGTGGHLFPAIALAEQLPQQLPEIEIAWLGVSDRLETQLVPDRYPLHTVPAAGFQSRSPIAIVQTLGKLLRSVWAVRQLLQAKRFDAVFTTGGYIAGPAIIAAKSLGIPSILHDSNAMPGKVTRWLGPWCDAVAVGFGEAARHLPRTQAIATGTPVRAEFWQPTPLDLPIPAEVPLVVVVGGSQGAVSVNELVRAAAPAWFEQGIWVVHQTGDRDPNAPTLQHPHYLAQPFFRNVAGLLQRANLVIGRAGAGTLTELFATGTPAILIPYPFAADDHQTDNGQVMVAAGAAEQYRQRDLTPAILRDRVLALLADPAHLAQMAQQARSLAVPDSAQQLAQLVTAVLDAKPGHKSGHKSGAKPGDRELGTKPGDRKPS